MRQDIKDKDGCDVEPEDSKDCRNRSEDHCLRFGGDCRFADKTKVDRP